MHFFVYDLPTVLSELYRFIGEGLRVTYKHCQGSSMHTLCTELSLRCMELLECLYPTEPYNMSAHNGVQYTEVPVISL